MDMKDVFSIVPRTARRDGRLWLENPEKPVAVRPCACFPWTDPRRHISLRDEEDNEAAFVRDLADLDEDSREAIELTLAEIGFVLEITAIHAIEEEFEIRNWDVETRQGPRTFQTEHDEWPWALENGGILIRDVAGDLFLIPSPAALDAASRKLLWAFLD